MKPRTQLNRQFHVQFKPEVTKDQINVVIEEMYRLSGCIACGLRGIDITLLGGDPELQIGKLPSLPGVIGAIAE